MRMNGVWWIEFSSMIRDPHLETLECATFRFLSFDTGESVSSPPLDQGGVEHCPNTARRSFQCFQFKPNCEISLIIYYGSYLSLSLYEPVSLNVDGYFEAWGRGIYCVRTTKTENDWLLVCAHSAPNNADLLMLAQAHGRSPLDWRSAIDNFSLEMWGISKISLIRVGEMTNPPCQIYHFQHRWGD